MQGTPREIRFLVPSFIALFAGLILLAVFLIAGQSSRARIMIEFEAERAATRLLEAFRAQGGFDASGLDPRVRAFGIYRSDGSLVDSVGSVPTFLERRPDASTFRFDRRAGTLLLVRTLGMGSPGMQGPMRGMMGRVRPLSMGPGAGAVLYMVLDISPFFRRQVLLRGAVVVAPVLIAGIAAAFLLLLTSNLRMRRRAEEQETLARLGDSARTLAHEIRNPLSAIRIQTGLLRRRLPEGNARELDVIDEETERLTMLSRRVGEFLKNPGGSPEQIRVGDFLRDLAGRLPHPVRVSPDIPAVVVSFDRDLLRSVIENLVRNAWESYDTASSTRDIEVSAVRQGPRVAVLVRDNGRGIPEGMAEKVFDPFFTDKVHGSGIGLPLSRRFVEAARGTLTLAPLPGGGTEARITLPAGGDA
jgi:two-component system, NtrC family, sensor histidine kinase HydH